MVGSNNEVPADLDIGPGCTIYPRIPPRAWPDGAVPRGSRAMRRNSDALVLLLCWRSGHRLNILVEQRAKPAVPFGGLYRIIDFSLSNVMNSGLTRIGVLTQYKPLSLMRHLGTGEAWDFTGRRRGIKILPPRTGSDDSDWYKGTADAIRQNIDFIEDHPSDEVVILSRRPYLLHGL